MSALLLGVGLLVAVFVGYNIGGSTTGPAFGPAVGAGVTGTAVAAALMSVSFFLGALTVGPEVVDTLAGDLLRDQSVFTLRSSAAVLFVIGAALFVGNYAGVPASTSMTAVGAIAALGFANGELDRAVLGEIVTWWLVAPIVGFWVAAVVGRYWYPRLEALLALEQRHRDRPLVTIGTSGIVPRPRIGSTGSRRELAGSAAVVGVGCLLAYASGTSNIANAVAPLYATGEIELRALVVVGSAAVAVGAFTIARRTVETLGNGVTDLPLPAAVVVAAISSGLVVGLSAVGIPASFVVVATMSIVGLGWGRASRATRRGDGAASTESSLDPDGRAAAGEPESPPGRGVDGDDGHAAATLYDPATTARVIVVQNVVPVVATAGAFALFHYVPVFGT